MANIANIQRVEASFSTKGKYKSKNLQKQVKTRYLCSKPRVLCYKTRVSDVIKLIFWGKTQVFDYITRLASRQGESSLHYSPRNSATATDPTDSPRVWVASRYPDSPEFGTLSSSTKKRTFVLSLYLLALFMIVFLRFRVHTATNFWSNSNFKVLTPPTFLSNYWTVGLWSTFLLVGLGVYE